MMYLLLSEIPYSTANINVSHSEDYFSKILSILSLYKVILDGVASDDSQDKEVFMELFTNEMKTISEESSKIGDFM